MITVGHTYITNGGFRRKVLDIYEDRYGQLTVKWEAADDPVPHGGNGRRPTTGIQPLSIFIGTLAYAVIT